MKDGSGNNLKSWLEFHEMNPVMARSDRAHATPEALQTCWRLAEVFMAISGIYVLKCDSLT